MPRATFCSHTCTNLIGLLNLNIYFAFAFPLTSHVSIVHHQKFQEAIFVPVPTTFTIMTAVHAFVTIVLIWMTVGLAKPNARMTVWMSMKVGSSWELCN